MQLDFCASEWSTGVHVPAEFSEDVLASYETHLKDIQHWASMNQGVVDNLRRKWYTRAMQVFYHPSLSEAYIFCLVNPLDPPHHPTRQHISAGPEKRRARRASWKDW
jgi:hypothetical protein